MIDTIYKADGSSLPTEPKDPATGYELEELQKIVGGSIELVQMGDGNVMVVDEDGLMKRRPKNYNATFLAGRNICGDVLVCASKAIK